MLPFITLAYIGDSQFLTVSKYIVLNHLLDLTWEAYDISPCYVFAFKSVVPYEVYNITLLGESL